MAKTKIVSRAFLRIKPKISREKAREIGRAIPQVPSDLIEPQLSENAAYIAKTRYAFRDDDGEPKETPKEMFWRIAYYIGAADQIYHDKQSLRSDADLKKTHLNTAKEFYNLMATQSFIPNTPTLLNSGKVGQSLSACFVLPVEDNMESILKTMYDMAMIHKMGGGTGFSFSRLRPKDDIIGTSKGKSTGPIAFMQAYNDVTSQIRQGGVRRGANMGILHYTHPDVLRFAVHKVDEFSLTNFNISVTVDQEFMQQIKEDEKYVEGELNTDDIIEDIKDAYTIRDLDLKNVRVEEGVKKLYEICRATHEDEGYELINPKSKVIVGKLNAKKVFDLITKLAWQYGDPGMILIDRVNNSRANPVPNIGQIEATNPCAEQPLHPYDACTLGSINLSKFVYPEGNRGVKSDVQSADVAQRIDWKSMKQAIHTSIHFLDNVLDMNEYPVAEIDEMTGKIRRVGLGVMGWADLLVKLGIGYDTQEGFDLAEKVMSFVQKEADNASVDLAKIRGVFPAFKGSIYNKPGSIKPRNGARTTIAPTGTISLLADCSSGIEPHFALTYAKNTIEGKRLFTTNQHLLKALQEKGLENEEILEKIGDNKGSVQGLDEIPDEIKRAFVVAGDITPSNHVRMAAAFQKFTDNGISKTINFPNEATVEDVREAYWLSYKLGCNMITIYRDGSRVKQVLEVKKGKSYYDQLAPQYAGIAGKKIIDKETGEEIIIPKKRPTPQEAWGMRVRKRADVGQVYTSVFRDSDGSPVEVFVNIGKTGGYISGAAEVTGRLASRALKYGASLEEVASDLIGISCGTPYGLGQNAILSAFDAVGKSLVEIAKTKQLQFSMENNQQEETVAEEVLVAQPSKVNLNGSPRFAGEAGYTNGHTNGYANSSPRFAGEAGHSNGVSNGHTNGQTNGYLNGTAQKDTVTNGVQMPLSSPKSINSEFGVPSGSGNQTSNAKTADLRGVPGPLQLHDEEKLLENKFTICPDCASPLVYTEGCRKCVNPTCGWSKCS
ncbi:MAG TPA: adenosylcobalamin-dependent ribonucleoside-diphosphate reductase [Patescibacteria group bacterium]